MNPKPGGRGSLLAVFLTVFIDLLGFGIVIPLLPIYTKAYQASELSVGLLMASFSAMQFLFAPFWGRLSDRVGRRPVLIGGLVGTSASYLVFAFADSLGLLFASRIAAGFFGANVATAQAYIADVTEVQDRAKGMGLVGAAFGLGFTVGPLVGGELTRFSPAAPGLAAAALSLAAATFGFFRLPEPARHSAMRHFDASHLRRALADGRMGVLLLLNFLALFAFSQFEAMFTLFGLAKFPEVFGVPRALETATMEQVLAAAPITGRYLAAIGVVSALIQGGLIRRLVPRFGEVRLIVAGPAFLALSLALVGLAPLLALGEDAGWALVLLGCAFLPVGIGLNNPSLAGLTSRAAPAAEQGSFLGLSQSAASLARVTGPPVGGAMFYALGPSAPFLASAGVLVLAAFLAAAYRRRYADTF
ncbi:MAG: MFS transporter [Planctomycetes bacterium]|nr:MFS transporter [Planctomycetota bacterium]